MSQVRPLPRSLDPLPDESLPGYLLRLAHRLGLPPQRVAELTGLATSSGVTPAERLLDLDTATAQSFAHATKLATDEVASLLLSGLRLDDRYLPLSTDIDGQPRQLRGIAHQEHWLFTKFTRWCPDCLAGDGSLIQQRHGGPWKRQWRLPVVFACTQHARLLKHLCPACHQPILTNTWGSGLIPRGRIADLHPAQCRAAPPAGTTASRSPGACGARLDTTGTTPDAEAPSAFVALQNKIVALLHPQGLTATHSLGHHVTSLSYFTDLRIVTTLISASWPAALDIAGQLPLMAELDPYLRDRHDRITLRRQHKTRPPEIVLHDQPPQPADACAALLALADQTLTAGDPDTAIHHLRDLADQAPLGPAWARRIIAVQERVSPGLQTALQPRLGRLARPTAGTVGSHLGPTRRGNFDHRHIPQRLPDAWFNRYVRHLQEGSHRLLRRAAAIRLVRMVNGGSYAQAGSHLGLSESATKTTLIQLSPWFRDKANSHAFTTALNALADELDAATALVDYGTRRQRLARWSIPPDEWRAITHGRGQTPPSRRGITDWGERKRRFVSWVVWTTITSSEHLFAPTTILPAHNPASRYGLRASLIGEWHAFHKHPWRHHAELAPIIHTYTNRVIHEIDGQPEVTDTPTIAPTLH
ncbi:TniQ family protein [Micromonospora chersina]|uniref:TniQ family protein n=1 Tax=Micromonospora chersina TaxID=47854 RepID=UPI003717DA28